MTEFPVRRTPARSRRTLAAGCMQATRRPLFPAPCGRRRAMRSIRGRRSRSPLYESLRSIEPLFAQDSGLHDQVEMFALIAKQRKVFQRIAVDEDGVGKGTWLQCTHLARHAQDLGADHGRRADDLDRRDDLLADGEFLRLVPMQLAQEIAAVGDRNAVALADLQRL